MAAEKAEAAAEPGSLVLAADTVVAAGRRILPKTEDEAEARTTLSLLSGRRHRVLSAVTLVDAEGKARHRLSTSIVAFKHFSEAELAAYLGSGEWRGKAGG
jgi:septum formation protein